MTIDTNHPEAVYIEEGVEKALQDNGYNAPYNSINVLPQDPEYIGFNLYLCKDLGTTTLDVDVVVDEKTVTVTSATGALVGDCINIRQGSKIFQSLIRAVNGTLITFASPLDNAFTAGATVCFGEWNLNIDGSTTPQIFKVCPPPDAKFHVASISITITDDATMDDSKFGSLTRLANGLICRRTDGQIFNYFLISNNAGFYQAGYDTQYPEKVPSGVYAFNARKHVMDTNGSIIALNGATTDEFQIIVQDNLTGISEFTIVVHGHIVED